MKILFLTNDINLQKGGQELANIQLINCLKKKHNLTFINQKFFSEGNHYGYIKNDYEIDFTKRGFINGFLDLIKILKKNSRANNFDKIIISSTPFSTLLFLFIIQFFGFFKNKQLIHWCHIDPLSSILQASRIPFILYPLGLFLYRRLDYIVVTNPYMSETFKRFYLVDKRKIKLITYPLRDNFEKLINEKIDFRFSRPVIISIARLTTIQKDPITLFKAFVIVKKKFPRATLLFLGDGPEKEKLKKTAFDLGIGESTKFLGFVKNPLAYLKKSDVFVLSSKSEGTPVVLIEAQACGIPIVASDCPVGPRWVLNEGKAGILVKIGHFKKMAEGIIKFLEDKIFREKKIKNGIIFNKAFSLNHFQTEWLKLLGQNK